MLVFKTFQKDTSGDSITIAMNWAGNLNEELIVLFSLLGLLQGMILSGIVLLYPKRAGKSNNLLALFIFSTSILLMAPIIEVWLDWRQVWIFNVLKFFSVIALYLYIRSLSRKVTPSNSWMHFVVIVGYTPVAYHYVHYLKETYGENIIAASIEDPYTIGIAVFNLLYLSFYLFLYIRAYKLHKAEVVENYSSLNKLGLNWIKALISGYFAVVVLSVMGFALLLINSTLAPVICLYTVVMICMYLYFVTIKGIFTPQVYSLRKLEEKGDSPKMEVSASAEHKDRKRLTLLSRRILTVMEKEALYKNESLSIGELAEHLDVQPYLVSRALNSVVGKSFFEFINEYRVEEAKRLLQDPAYAQYSLVAIGYEAGFSSKTTFNTVFKKLTGSTPSAYKKKTLSKTA